VKKAKAVVFFIALLLVFMYRPKAYASPEEIVMNAIQYVESFLKTVLNRIYSLALDVMRLAYNAMLAVGILLYATGFDSFRGKRLIVGALVLAAATEGLATI